MSERIEAVEKEEVIEENLLESVQAESVQAQSVQAESVQPEAEQPEAVAPEVEAVGADVAEAEATAPIAAHPDTTGPDTTEPDTTEPEAAQSEAEMSATRADETGADETRAVEAEAVEPAAQAKVEATEVAEAEIAETVQPETVQPEAVQPEAADAAEESGPPAGAQPEASEDSTPSPAPGSDSTATKTTAEPEKSQDEKKVVRTLAVGQQLTGTVKRIADFGAFVDIGVGRDGLIHISELSIRRVGKVTDVLQEGQEIEAWIKKLDRDRNRISLTLIDPDTKTIRDLQKGDVVKGRVTRLLPYGAFVDIGIGRDALLHVREMAEGFVAKPEDVVTVDEELEARVIDLSRRRSRVDLSLKGLRPEPEAAVPHQTESRNNEPPVEEEVVEDTFEDVEVLSVMELAFKRAIEAEGIEAPTKKKGKRSRRMSGRDLQDEIISRTLSDNRR